MNRPSLAVSIVFGLTALSPSAGAQCEPTWVGGYGLPIPNGPVSAALSAEENGEPVFYIAGDFTAIQGIAASRVARWSPSRGWRALGSGLDGLVVIDAYIHGQALAYFDDGSGPALYVAGQFETAGGVPCKNIARWNGTSWSAVGAGLAGLPYLDFVYALQVHDDGSGSKLYAGGNFSNSGGTPISKIASWDGTAWSSVGGGINGQPGDGVYALAEYDDPSSGGPKLYAGGVFSDAGGVGVSALACWNGTTWSNAGTGGGANGAVRALHAFDDGSGPRLYAGGDFTLLEVSANRIAVFDGEHWSAIGAGLGAPVSSLGSFDSGTGERLFAGGSFTYNDGVQFTRVVRVLSSGFEAVHGGPKTGNQIRSLAKFDVGAGQKLFVGGKFVDMHSGTVPNAAFFDGSEWSLIGGNPGGFGGADAPTASAFQDVDHGGSLGRRSYVGGSFNVAGNVFTRGIVRLDGSAWIAMGGVSYPGISASADVHALASFDFGAGEELVVGGGFSRVGSVDALNVARYDGQSWSPMGLGLIGLVFGFEMHDEGLGAGTQLYACGNVQIVGAPSQCYVARWNGSAWQAVGNPGGAVKAIASYDDGTGRALYATTNSSGTPSSSRIVRWNGVTWTPIGNGLDSAEIPTKFAVFDSGNGSRLHVGSNPNALREWDGATWALVTTAPGPIQALQPFDDGLGLKLYIACSSANRVVRWDGSTLSNLGAPMGSISALGVLDTANGPALFVGGSFASAYPTDGGPGVPSNLIARWGTLCPPAGEAFCSGDGSATACPCGNVGAPGHGCATSFDANGAQLSGAGVPRVGADTFALHASGVSNSVVTFIQGSSATNGGLGTLFGDGLRCAGGAVLRLGSVLAASNAASYPNPGQQPVSIRGAIPPLANVSRAYQVWYRNSVSFCTPSTFNLTNGWMTYWAQ